MNRLLQILNLLGVLVLAGLCAAQWQTNRTINAQAETLETTRLAQQAQLTEQAQQIKGQQADLEQLRLRLTAATGERDTAQAQLKSTTTERDTLAASDQKNKAQLALQADQFQKELDQWQAAVKARDEALAKANAALKQLAADRNATVEKYNDLAKQCNQLGLDRNAAVQKFNDLVAKYNALVKQVEDANAKAKADIQAAKDAEKKEKDNGAHLNVAP